MPSPFAPSPRFPRTRAWLRRSGLGPACCGAFFTGTLLFTGSWVTPPEDLGALPPLEDAPPLAYPLSDAEAADLATDAWGLHPEDAAAWAQALPPDVRRRFGIPLPPEARPLFPDAGDSLLIDPETLWLARCIYSESNRSREQEVVAWVVRNRVATGYRGERTYRGVVLDPYQFSAFNRNAKHRAFYLGLTPEHGGARWRRALMIAAYVRRAPWSQRPFPLHVRHFYSEISMRGRRHPTWALGQTPVAPDRPYAIDPYRFRFFDLGEPAAPPSLPTAHAAP